MKLYHLIPFLLLLLPFLHLIFSLNGFNLNIIIIEPLFQVLALCSVMRFFSFVCLFFHRNMQSLCIYRQCWSPLKSLLWRISAIFIASLLLLVCIFFPPYFRFLFLVSVFHELRINGFLLSTVDFSFFHFFFHPKTWLKIVLRTARYGIPSWFYYGLIFSLILYIDC